MDEKNHELSIIIVHHKTPDFLKLCLDSIKESLSGIDYEVILVDSGAGRLSRDIAKKYEKELDRLTYIGRDINLGYSKGVNLGLKNSYGNYLLILNPDIIIKKGAIDCMLSYMKLHPDIGLLGPKMLHFNGETQRTYFRFYKPMTIIIRRTLLPKWGYFKKVLDDFLMSDTNPSEIQTPDWLMGSALMTRKEAVDRVGHMDERFFMYFEDVDWARRFWHNGYKVVYYPKAVFYHYHKRQSKSKFGILDIIFNQKTRWHIASAVKFFLKYSNLEVLKKDAE